MYKYTCVYYASSPRQEKLYIWPPFFQYNKRLLSQKTGGACVYMPQDAGHWLANFEVIPPFPQKLVFPRPKKEHFKGCAPLPKKISDTFFFFYFLAVFVENTVTPISTLANNKRSCSKYSKISVQNCVFLFFRRTFWHNFVTPFSTFANIKGSLPTNSTTPDQLR